MRIAASAEEEGGKGQGGRAEEVGEPVAEIDGGELGGQSGQPAPGAAGARTGQAWPIPDTLLLHEPVIGSTRPKRGFGSSSLHGFPFPYCLAEAGVVDGLARVHKLTFKVGQDQLAVPIALVPLPGELRQLSNCL